MRSHLLSALVFMITAAVPATSQPEDMAPVTVTVQTTPSPGGLYLAPNCRLATPPYAPYFMVLDNTGVPVRWKKLPEYAFDSRVLPDGRLGYSVFQSAGTGPRVTSTLHRLDSNLANVDTLKGANGYPIAMHNFTVLPNGNRLIIAQENLTINMTEIVEGGHPAAAVQQMLVQEITPDGQLIFQFRCLDHLPITASYEDLKAASIRPFHLNAIWEDTDGNFLMSIRHSSMIIKVDRTTGDIIWILGGKLNQFTFTGEREENAPTYFSYQHDIRRLPNGNITLFDNGTQHKPQYSRGVEYRLNEQAKTCELVWEYRHVPDIYTSLQGSMQTLPDGHRLLAWGSGVLQEIASITEVDADKNVVFEAKMNKDMYPFSVTKHPVPPGRPAARVFIDEILQGNTYVYDKDDDSTGLTITYTSVESFFYNSTEVHRFAYAPSDPMFEGGHYPMLLPVRLTMVQDGMTSHYGEFRFRVETLGIPADQASRYSVYRRDTIGKGVFTRQATRYNPVTRQIIVDSMQAGEFAFGIDRDTVRTANKPLLYSPGSRKRVGRGVRTAFRFSPQGLATHHRVVIRSVEDDAVVFDQEVTADRAFASIGKVGTYTWTVESIYKPTGTSSALSDVDTFFVTGNFIEILRPQQIVEWTQDSSYAIVWETNVPAPVRLELLKADTVAAVIKDSVPVSATGFLWKVPVTVPEGEYTLRARTFGADSVTVVTETPFTISIKKLTVSVHDIVDRTTSTIAPNPSSDVMYIGGVDELSYVSVFDVNGVLVLQQTVQGTGTTLNVRELPSGTYHVLLRKGMATEHHTIVVNR